MSRQIPARSGALAAVSRRECLGVLSGAAGLIFLPRSRAAAQPEIDPLVQRNDDAAEGLIRRQVTISDSPWRGSVPDAAGLHGAGSAAGLIETCAASFLHPRSRLRGEPDVLQRIRLAAGFLERSQSPQGNIDLLTTNFNSPPDTGFVVHNVATAARIAQLRGGDPLVGLLRPFLTTAGGGLATGGVHTPNHRWVICSALAQIDELFPDARYRHRIDQWLGEGIDIDADGQFTERSTLTYNVVTDRALLVMGIKLRRPDLFEPVRRNLRTLRYLVHADGEVVTEISRRQDQYTRGGLGGYWFPATWLAIRDRDPEIAGIAARALDGGRLSTLMEYPELAEPLPAPAPLPDDFDRVFPAIGIARVRRGPASGTVVLGGSSRFLAWRSGAVVIEGIRFASAFFGKGQFIPDQVERDGATYRLRQALEAPYYQPLGRPITTETWAPTRAERARSEVARLVQSAEVSERPRGLAVRVQSSGTAGVPLAIEIAFRSGGTLSGCSPVDGERDTYVLDGEAGEYRIGGESVRFGPGSAPHRYVQVRGAEPRLAGLTVYITGYTPFDRTLTFDWR